MGEGSVLGEDRRMICTRGIDENGEYLSDKIKVRSVSRIDEICGEE